MTLDSTGPPQALQRAERSAASLSPPPAWVDNQAAALAAAIDAIAEGVLITDTSAVRHATKEVLRLLDVAAADELQIGLDELGQRFRLRRARDGPLLATAELPFAAALDGHAVSMELWATPAGGAHDVGMRCVATPICVDGPAIGVVTVLGDLREPLQLDEQGRDLRRVQTVLEERNAELRALTDGVRDYAIYTLNPAGHIASWHPGAARLKGYSAEEAIGMPYGQLFTPEQRRAGQPELEMEAAARYGEFKGDGPRLRKDGSLFEAAVVLTALRDARGELLGFLKLTQDISERKRMQRELEAMLLEAQQARKEAERASQLKDEFLATISHELRTPLSAILGWAHVLERGGLDPETVRHGLTAISRNARTQVQLIEDLLDMDRIETGRLRLDLQRIDLGGVVAAAIESALPAATAKGIAVRPSFAHHATVMGDAARLQQVLANLLNNAVKFTPTGGTISVSLTQADGRARIAVSDTGQGIEAEFLPRLFGRFQQQDASTTRRHGGLGIGLSIVRHLVELHGGTVHAHSAGRDRGATFVVTLPLADLAAGAGGPAGPARAERLDGLTVLLVDDEADVRAVTELMLRNAGADVVVAASAEQALRLLRERRPAVILSDIGMPQADGYELMRRVRELPASEGGATPAATFTAYARAEDRERALAAGFQMHLSKPVTPDELVSKLVRLAQGHRDARAGPD